MKIITLCGSLRFQKEMMQVAKELSLNGDCVLSPIYFSLQENNITKEQLLKLKQAHFKRIELNSKKDVGTEVRIIFPKSSYINL